MQKKYLFIPVLVLLVLVLLVLGCSEEGPRGEAGPERLSGDVEGRVVALDEFGTSMVSPEGITVTMTGDAAQASDVTDQEGGYLLTGLLTGHYYMEFEKQGFGKYANNYVFLGGDLVEVVSERDIRELSSTMIEEFNVALDGSILAFDGTISPASIPDTAERSVFIFFYHNDSVSNRIFTQMLPINTYYVDSTSYYYEMYMSDQFTRGQTLYMAAYGFSGYDWWSNIYWDNELDKSVFNVNENSAVHRTIEIPFY